jgi:dTDP-4-amino-4,6-dideoxygalactose transaminase
MPLIQLGLRPVPIDIELDTLNISSQTLQKVLQTTSFYNKFTRFL